MKYNILIGGEAGQGYLKRSSGEDIKTLRFLWFYK
jgi:hypothetical protein